MNIAPKPAVLNVRMCTMANKTLRNFASHYLSWSRMPTLSLGSGMRNCATFCSLHWQCHCECVKDLEIPLSKSSFGCMNSDRTLPRNTHVGLGKDLKTFRAYFSQSGVGISRKWFFPHGRGLKLRRTDRTSIRINEERSTRTVEQSPQTRLWRSPLRVRWVYSGCGRATATKTSVFSRRVARFVAGGRVPDASALIVRRLRCGRLELAPCHSRLAVDGAPGTCTRHLSP